MHKTTAALLAAAPLALAQNFSGPESPLWNLQSPPKYPSPWGEGLGDWDAAYQKARDFVSQLTLTEKVNLTTGVGWQSEKCVGNVAEIPRLAFQSLCLQDSPLGVRFKDFASAFPALVTIASTWDRQVFYDHGYAMGETHRDSGVDVQLGPVVGPLGRAPEGGRNWEGYSPDPVLSGLGVAGTVKGIQDAGIMACTKHYILNEQEHFRQGPPPENLTESSSSNLDDVTMHELYLWPFADAVRAGTASIMCSYQQINNSYGCQNSYTQNYLLKNELGFQGFILSDWQAQHSGVSSALAGLDMTMPGDTTFNSAESYWGANLTIAVLNGTIPQWRIDDMAVRVMAGYYYVDRPANLLEGGANFDSWTLDTYGYRHFYAEEGYEQINFHVDVEREHYQQIRRHAAMGTVLLKNTNGALPLSNTEKLTTVFGSDSTENGWGPNGCPDRGCDNGTFAMGWGSGTANFPYLITPLEAIKNEVRSRRGFVESVTDDFAYDQAAALAARVGQPGVGGACIVFSNAVAGEGYIIVDGNEGDRNNLTLWHNGTGLVNTVASNCNNTIVVIHSVGPVLLDEFYDNENVTAIVWAGVPGQESGNAITDILYGRMNPGGKSPFTWGPTRRSYGTDVLYTLNNGVEAPQTNFDEGVFIDYRHFDRYNITPIYEFGYGLSYTTFEYSNLQVESHGIPEYVPTTGNSPAAPTYGTISNDSSEYVYPEGFNRIEYYIYPFINSTDLEASSGDPYYGTNYTFPPGSSDGAAQPYLGAGGAPGGNPQLYDILFTVRADITNTGDVAGDEVPQLYVSRGGPNDPVKELRDFDRVSIQPGESATFVGTITRRDISNWDPVTQNWVITNAPKRVWVGCSSRQLPLNQALDLSGGAGGYDS